MLDNFCEKKGLSLLRDQGRKEKGHQGKTIDHFLMLQATPTQSVNAILELKAHTQNIVKESFKSPVEKGFLTWIFKIKSQISSILGFQSKLSPMKKRKEQKSLNQGVP